MYNKIIRILNKHHTSNFTYQSIYLQAKSQLRSWIPVVIRHIFFACRNMLFKLKMLPHNQPTPLVIKNHLPIQQPLMSRCCKTIVERILYNTSRYIVV